MNASSSPTPPPPRQGIGYAYGLAAYALWGFMPIYFKLVKVVPPTTIVAQRICWSLLVLLVLITLARGWPAVWRAASHRGTMLLLVASSTLIAANWLLYVYAVNSGHVIASSLGYYLNPLANILLGRFVLKERLSRLQWAAVGIAGLGIAVLAAAALHQLWLSVLLCVSFSGYGLVRKIVAAEALAGLVIETALLLGPALAWLILSHAPGAPALGPTAHLSAMLAASGVVSTIPLLMFTAAARRLPYSTMGMLQFIAPTCQLLLAVFVYGEPFGRSHALAFGAIWLALLLYVAALVGAARRERAVVQADRLSGAAESGMVR